MRFPSTSIAVAASTLCPFYPSMLVSFCCLIVLFVCFCSSQHVNFHPRYSRVRAALWLLAISPLREMLLQQHCNILGNKGWEDVVDSCAWLIDLVQSLCFPPVPGEFVGQLRRAYSGGVQLLLVFLSNSCFELVNWNHLNPIQVRNDPPSEVVHVQEPLRKLIWAGNAVVVRDRRSSHALPVPTHWASGFAL